MDAMLARLLVDLVNHLKGWGTKPRGLRRNPVPGHKAWTAGLWQAQQLASAMAAQPPDPLHP